MSDLVLVASGLTKSYRQGEEEIKVLAGAELEVRGGEHVAVVGRSGSGKSTLLHVLAGLDDAHSGCVEVMGENIMDADSNRRAEIRRNYMGFVYQAHHLLAEFTAQENVAMPLRLAGVDAAEAAERSLEMLDKVDLRTRATHVPHALSGGERQRVAVARALAHSPKIVLADEPTGNLDHHNAAQVMSLLADLSQAQGTAFLVVTHDLSMLGHFDRVLHLEGGQLAEGTGS